MSPLPTSAGPGPQFETSGDTALLKMQNQDGDNEAALLSCLCGGICESMAGKGSGKAS